MSIEIGEKTIDLSGRKFNRLLVMCAASRNHRNEIKWLCICDCGNLTITRSNNLVTGHANSCGCYRKDVQLKAVTTHGHTSNKKLHPSYYVWLGMKFRCSNPKATDYHNYGGRGITVCDRWRMSFQDFIDDMGERPSKKYSIDRIDVNGNYEPGNCRWATKREQNFNIRTNVWVEFKGEKMVMAEFKRRIGCQNTSRVNTLLKTMSTEEIEQHYLNKRKTA